MAAPSDNATSPATNESWETDISFHFEKVVSLISKKQEELHNLEKDLKAREINMETDYAAKMEALKVEKEQMLHMHQLQTEKVKLDVGGTLYATSKSTLQKYPDSMLGVMFSGRHALHLSEDGSYFIDRDGCCFRYILNYLRGCLLEPSDLPEDVELLRDLRREADYFQLRGLLDLVNMALTPPPMNQFGDADFTQVHIDTMLSAPLLNPNAMPAARADPMLLINQFHPPIEHPLPLDRDPPPQKVTRCALDFSNKNLRGLSFAHTSFLHNVSFKGASLAGASFYGCEFVSSAFVDFQGADLTGCDFRQCKGKAMGSRLARSVGNTRSGLVSGASSDTLLSLLQQQRLDFRNSNWMQALFDQRVWNCLQLSCPSFKVLGGQM